MAADVRQRLASAVAIALLMWIGGPAASVAQTLPADDASAREWLDGSSRHGEYVDIAVAGGTTPLRAFVVYPERPDKAPVVLVVHDVFGLSDWVRAVADRLAAEGFIAIALDLRNVDPKKDVPARLDTARAYGTKLPSANGKSTVASLSGTIESIQNGWPAALGALHRQTK